MKNFIVLLFMVAFSLCGQERFSQVRIPVPDPAAMARLADLGVAVDHFHGKVGGMINVFLSEHEIEILKNNNISYTILINDWHEFYAQTLKKAGPEIQTSASTPENFKYGTMGGFLTYHEALQQLDSMKILFPSLITGKDSIGHSIEGRPIYAYKISDNPTVNESAEPEVLYTALHHAREPQGMMTVIYYMWWLLENYGINAEATYLVNNRQLWFIPVVNPDGYIYNQSIHPAGGGMWRKNRRTNAGGTFGVDLNRNYGPEYMWNSPNGGSSTTAGSDVYRGTAPFSEPETQTIDRFLRERNIRTCFNYHTYSNLLIYPWGYTSAESHDSLTYREWAYDMTMENRYALGTDLQTVAYSTRGNSDDYMYGDTTNGKSPTYSMTPEVGSTGFWPTQPEIIPLADENLAMNKQLAYYAGSYPFVRNLSFEDTLGNSIYSPLVSFKLKLTIANKGLTEGRNINVDATSDLDMYAFTPTQIPTLPLMSETIITLTGMRNHFQGDAVRFFVRLSDSSGVISVDSTVVRTTTSEILFSDDAANGLVNWNASGGWNTTGDAYSPPLAFTDSPTGKYAANANSTLTLKNAIFLPPPHNELRFRTKWSIEPTWDFGIIEASTDNGSTWKPLRTKLSRRGSGREYSAQPSVSFGYDGFNPSVLASVVDQKKYWIEQTADLAECTGSSVLIRFRLSTDGGEERDGWSLDDIRIVHYNFAPLSADSNPVIADSYELLQNFPNPFNPSTTIRFSIPQSGQTELAVFDLIGRRISTLIERELHAGSYTARFETEGLSAGIYFYRLVSGSYTSTKKMTVLK
jgi:hypothetical protein